MSEYPVQVSKVQAPPLREETLARDRLLEWLSVKIHRRAVLLVAEAGYGKTTLLADFSRRTRIRVLWFRLDRGDRDWVGFLAHLVAAVRVHIPDFGSATNGLLRETATAAPPLDTVLDTFLRELGGLPNEPSAIVFDDVHLVDDSPEIRHVLRELLARGPERMSFVFATRREPPVRLARLRALGEVAELGTDDLRFDAAETERLFRETYAMRIEPAVLSELNRRTEGWAASLQLVRAALHDRDPGQVRAFVSSLSGAEGHLYEYLAEEVVGELPVDLQRFLMQTSVLETVDLILGPVAAEVDAVAARTFIDDGERHGLFGKGTMTSRYIVRAHPLVRDFLLDRLTRSSGEDGVKEIHLRVARVAESFDWRLAARHFLASGQEDDARRVLTAAIDQILAAGAYAAAQELAASLPSGGLMGSADLVLRSRMAQQRGSADEALQLAERAWIDDPGSMAVLLNLVTARTLAGDVAGALEANQSLQRSEAPELAAIGRAYQRVIDASLSGSLEIAATELRSLADGHRLRGQHHFLGVALLNEALTRHAMGQGDMALACADEAILLLEASSAGVELVSARLARTGALAYLGDIAGARAEVAIAERDALAGQRLEVATEAADAETFHGRSTLALAHLQTVGDRVGEDPDNGDWALLVRAVAQAHLGSLIAARADLDRITIGKPRTTTAFELRRQLAECLVSVLTSKGDAGVRAEQARQLAAKQGAATWFDYANLLKAAADVTADPSPSVVATAAQNPVVLSMAAEAVLTRLVHCSNEAIAAVREAASKRPWRWLEPVRLTAADLGPSRLLAAQLLEDIGELSDVPLLRRIARGSRAPQVANLGRGLARRLATRVLVDDLGRVRVHVGDRTVEGSGVRRKVLALLCLLLSRPRWTATREDVVDSLWPELDPQSALNSLNQTVYFLRRVFEPSYQEETSPGYLRQDGETIWLDPDLIESRSRRCHALIRSSDGEPDAAMSLALASEYLGRFALDFAYEEWAGPYRDNLHAAYLRVIESSVRLDVDSGNYTRGVFLAERASEIEPDSEELQLSLVRVYRLAGAHAAASERYAHYSKLMEDLGAEPRPFAEL